MISPVTKQQAYDKGYSAGVVRRVLGLRTSNPYHQTPSWQSRYMAWSEGYADGLADLRKRRFIPY